MPGGKTHKTQKWFEKGELTRSAWRLPVSAETPTSPQNSYRTYVTGASQNASHGATYIGETSNLVDLSLMSHSQLDDPLTRVAAPPAAPRCSHPAQLQKANAPQRIKLPPTPYKYIIYV